MLGTRSDSKGQGDGSSKDGLKTSAESSNSEFLYPTLLQMHEMHKEFKRSCVPRGSYVYLDSSCHQKRHVRTLAQIQLFITTAYAELFKGRDKNLKLMEFLKDILKEWTKEIK